MLRIDLIQNEQTTVFHLEGQLVGDWVEELRAAWVETRPYELRADEYVDLNLVTRVDAAGLHLLNVMHLAGVRFVATAPYTVSLLEDLNGEVLESLPDETSFRQTKRFRFRVGESAALRAGYSSSPHA